MDKQTAKLIARIAENLPAMESVEMQRWIDDPKGLQDALKKAFRPSFVPCVFKTIKLGTGLKTPDDFSQALKEGGCKVSDWAKDILGKPEFTVADHETTVELIVLTTAELTGNPKGGTTAEVFAGAARRGLDKCPAEVGPQLRLQYPDQPMGEWLLIAMEPISDSDGHPHVFHVERDAGGLWLYGNYGRPDDVWGAAHRWVFLSRK